MKQPSKLKLGELLIQEGFLTPEQLALVLVAQKGREAYVPLGEVCIEMDLLSRSDLEKILRTHRKRIPLGELLTNLGLITLEHLQEALNQQKTGEKKRIGKILLERGFINGAALIGALNLQLGVPRISPHVSLIDKKLLDGLSPAFLRKNEVLPAFKQGDELTLIMADPLNETTIRDLEKVFRCKIQPAIAATEEIHTAISQCFQSELGAKDTSREPEKDLVIGQTDLSRESGDNIVGIVNYIISNAILERASDIHVEPQDRILRVRYRIDGVLHHKTDLPMFLAPSLVSRIKVLCGLDIAERRRHQDGRIEARVMNKEIDLRVSTYAAVYGESVVIRILQRESTLIDLDALGFAPANRAKYTELLDSPSGIMLVTGPTGSGKTTTVYASLNYLNKTDRKIITVEDPVEYTLAGVVQGQLDPKLELSYADFLKSMMRQDPDVIMVGEIRDREVAVAVVQSALTGHKVLSTFHTDDTTGALLRLMDMGIEPSLIASTLVAVISQRLVRSLCRHCRQPVAPRRELLASFHIDLGDLDTLNFYQPKGCLHCNGTGFKGRTAIHELLVVNDAIRDAILAHKTSTQIRLIARNEAHLISMREDGFYKATQGITSLEEITRVVFHSESDELAPRSAEEVMALCQGKEPPAAMGPSLKVLERAS
jgi:type IV pilus assembly protein PilB